MTIRIFSFITLILFFLVSNMSANGNDLVPGDMDFLIKNPKPYSAQSRHPAAIPIDETEVKEKVKQFFSFQDATGNNVDFEIVDSYGKTRFDQYGRRKIFHSGWDIEAPMGTIIKWVNEEHAVSGKKYDWPWRGNPDYSNLGNQTIIYTHNNNFKLKFCHLQRNHLWDNWQEDVIKSTGQTVGNIGISGRPPSNLTSPAHLHLEVSIKVKDDYKLTDPLAYFMLASCCYNAKSCNDINSTPQALEQPIKPNCMKTAQ